MVSFMLWSLDPWGNSPQYQKLGLPQCQSGHYGKERNSTFTENLMPFVQRTLAILLTEISELILQVNISKEINEFACFYNIHLHCFSPQMRLFSLPNVTAEWLALFLHIQAVLGSYLNK
jgi:hypothetical protein